jgi:hypothetical protein
MAARMDPARVLSSRDRQPSPWGWRGGAWGWGADEDDPTVDTEEDDPAVDTEPDTVDGYAITDVADTGAAAGSSAYLIVRFLSEFLTEEDWA